MKSIINKQISNGFTIVELTIATSVFAIILLLSLVGFIQIGKLFYKGVNITHTSDVSKQVLNSIKGDVSFDIATTAYNSDGVFASDNKSAPNPATRYYFCAGANRYTFILGQELNSSAETNEMKTESDVSKWNKFALLKDRVNTSGCPRPFTSTSDPIDRANVTELLGDKMRLSRIEINQLPSPNDKLYTIHIKIAYGDNEVFQGTTATSDNPVCNVNGTTSASFCFVSDLRTIVRKGL